MGESGHIAGIVNHPDKNKYGFWTNESLDESASDWLSGASHTEGSWWKHWNEWLSKFNDEEPIDLFRVGSDQYPVLDKAPGKYVKQVLPIEES